MSTTSAVAASIISPSVALSAMPDAVVSDDMEWAVVSDSMLWNALHMDYGIGRGPDHPIDIVVWASLASNFKLIATTQARARAS